MTRLLITTLIIVVSTTALPTLVAQQPEQETPDEALTADLQEAIQMIGRKQYRMLILDFMPQTEQVQMEAIGNRRTGSRFAANSVRSNALLNEQRIAELLAHCSSALEGKRLYNRHRTLVEITYVRKPVELVPASKPKNIPTLAERPAGNVTGLGANLNKTIQAAIALLELGRTEQFVRSLYPLPDLARLEEGDQMKRHLFRLTSNKSISDTMLRDLRACLSGAIQQNQNIATVSLPPLVVGDDPRIVKFELIDGNWRFFDSSRTTREQHKSLLQADIGSFSIPGTRGSMLLSRVGDSWRLIAMPRSEPLLE